jgi:hypothetical protein
MKKGMRGMSERESEREWLIEREREREARRERVEPSRPLASVVRVEPSRPLEDGSVSDSESVSE